MVWVETAGIVYLIDSNVHSICCLDHWVDYANESSMEDDEYMLPLALLGFQHRVMMIKDNKLPKMQ